MESGLSFCSIQIAQYNGDLNTRIDSRLNSSTLKESSAFVFGSAERLTKGPVLLPPSVLRQLPSLSLFSSNYLSVGRSIRPTFFLSPGPWQRIFSPFLYSRAHDLWEWMERFRLMKIHYWAL